MLGPGHTSRNTLSAKLEPEESGVDRGQPFTKELKNKLFCSVKHFV